MADYWLVMVQDPAAARNRDHRLRFYVDPEDPQAASAAAWACYARATHHGFLAQAEYVAPIRGRESDTPPAVRLAALSAKETSS